MIWLKRTVYTRLSAPPHIGIGAMLFRRRKAAGYQFWKVGFTVPKGRVNAPYAGDIVIDFSPDNIKLLAYACEQLRNRRLDLKERWWNANQHARDIISHSDRFFIPPGKDLGIGAYSLLHHDIPALLKMNIPVTGRKGGINNREEGTTLEQRLLFLRGVRQVRDGKETFTETYVNVCGGDGEVTKSPGDVIIAKNEETFARLYHFHDLLQDSDLIAPDQEDLISESKKRGSLCDPPRSGTKKSKPW